MDNVRRLRAEPAQKIEAHGAAREQTATPAARVRFGAVEVDFATAQLRCAGRATTLSARTLGLLQYLMRNRERLVSREELLAEVWRGVTVSEGSLRQAILELRRALGKGPERHAIENVRGLGYRFVGAPEREPPALTTEVPEPGVVRGSERPALFGREQDRTRLERTLQAASEDGGRTCVIVGPPGIGKSRLAREAVRMAQGRHVLQVEGQADPDGFAPAFWHWKQILSGYVEHCGSSQRARWQELSPAALRVLELQSAVRDTPPVVPIDHAEQRFALLEELGRLFMTLARDVPSLILLEDLQWADESSLALLHHLAPLFARTRSLLLITCRDVRPREQRSLARVLQAIARTPLAERIELIGLGLSDIVSVLHAHVPGGVPESVCTEVYQLSRGNPLLALELARLVARHEGEGSPLLQPLQAVELHSVVRRHLQSLPEGSYQVLCAGSVLTPEFTLAELAGILQEPAQVVLTHLDRCIEHGVIVHGNAALRFRFAHPLMRESAYAGLAREDRSRWHRLAGEWIERQSPPDTRLNELAHHFFAAAADGVAPKAVHYAVRCAELAYAATAYAEAAAHYERALACADLEPASSAVERLEIELARGEALRASGADAARVDDHFLTIAASAEALGDPRLFARAILGYTGQRRERFSPTHIAASAHPREIPLLERALRGVGEGPSELRVLLLCSLVYALSYSTDRARRERLAAEARELASARACPWLTARVLATNLYCCAAPDQQRERLRACDELI
ncbi:MAG TPA: AAA family ATPase, partial [Polyangiaceae bacterium]|nr:AAA family ATPase [Polyangiaceae bacterium]